MQLKNNLIIKRKGVDPDGGRNGRGNTGEKMLMCVCVCLKRDNEKKAWKSKERKLSGEESDERKK